jgi:hypothetical protein
VGHLLPLIGQGGPKSHPVSSPRHGQGVEMTELSKVLKLKAKKMMKTNIVPPT